ncbi:unnamed protein product [Gongylonema pulchrum]|uniref:Glyco_hydro_38N domain-containing protein n=1 Tax=Gongylonema pulchrum TaxID=637853 RepID=A0A183EAG6_9BILA|nr:unnamed protein product [Gongylonema pulchrum]
MIYLDVLAQVMWSNDPFGYGPSVPYLFTKTGIHRAVINRILMELMKCTHMFYRTITTTS